MAEEFVVKSIRIGLRADEISLGVGPYEGGKVGPAIPLKYGDQNRTIPWFGAISSKVSVPEAELIAEVKGRRSNPHDKFLSKLKIQLPANRRKKSSKKKVTKKKRGQ
ncbi:MAG: hypothetical protein MI923_07300 [Phycisphaerales bacterium]|nr:hypothetical protein [Phycisphaerales bacterium]